MVTNLQQLAGRPTRSAPRDPAPTFPLSSPHHETLTSFKPANSVVSLAPKDAFLSPNPFGSSSSDDESGSSSGQDEFHLERYSQDTHRPAQSSRPSRKQSRRQKQQEPPQDKKARPGLNIVTSFSATNKRSKTDGLVFDQVQAQRPRLGPRYATSIKSAKAEHMEHPFVDPTGHGPSITAEHSKRAIARQAVSKLQESQIARRKAAEMSKTKETMNFTAQGHSTIPEDHLQNPVSAASGYSPGARSIVIGMSVPEDEVDNHRSAGGGNNVHSANTPDTPAIVITPADETDSWKPSFFSKPRPSSSVYSNARNGLHVHISELPPVPRIPDGHAQWNTKDQPAVAMARGTDLNIHQTHPDDAMSDDENDHLPAEQGPRASTDSEEPILPSDIDQRRHKSQGWWNLMLSPMLSRKGTIAERAHKSPETPPVPSIPVDIRLSRDDIVSPLTAESPETPRRAGMASTRASVWSRWTTWERQRDGEARSMPVDARDLEAEQPRDMVQASSQVPPLPTVDLGKGLAAEYYHACAVEQLTGVAFFECENHSCMEQLPQLHSIFDKEVTSDASLAAGPSRALNVNTLQVPNISNLRGESDESNARKSAMSDGVMNRGVSIRTEPEELSPNVRQADTATVVKARALEPVSIQRDSPPAVAETQPHQTEEQPSHQENASSLNQTRDQTQYPNIAAVAPAGLQPPIMSPGPVSPGMQRSMADEGAVPMTQIDHQMDRPRLLEQSPAPYQQTVPAQMLEPVAIHYNHFYGNRRTLENRATIEQARKEAMERLESAHATREDDRPAQALSQKTPAARDEPTEEKKEKRNLWSKLKSLIPKKKAADTAEQGKKKRRWTVILSVILFLIVLGCILLATLLTRSGDGTPVQNQWLNLTGYPPMPTGISTIARPDVVKQQSKCVAPNTMWSCALPKEDQFEVAPNSPDQPNFRFQIAFRNGTVPANMTIPVGELRRRSMASLAERASNPFSNDQFTANPTPPSRADQIFMGNTTDNVTQPFDGEQTPFFITFIPVFPIDPSNTTAAASDFATSVVSRRQASNSPDDIIPDPDVLDDGSAAPANLVPTDPFPTSQPIKLYNRGLADEHYGFYIYYDKAIFLQSTAALNTSEFADNGGILPEDENGGSTRDRSQLRCTFSQTRFLVRMWTNPAFGATLLPRITGNGTNDTNADGNNSATDFSRPGSFPYPTTISIDRHGGNVNKKAVYCYGVNQLQVIQTDVKGIVPEFRAVEGTLINPAPALINGTASDDGGFDQEAGGIDGGTGGCECVWQNWN